MKLSPLGRGRTSEARPGEGSLEFTAWPGFGLPAGRELRLETVPLYGQSILFVVAVEGLLLVILSEDPSLWIRREGQTTPRFVILGPETLKVNASLASLVRTQGIFNVPLYSLEVSAERSFFPPGKFPLPVPAEQMQWEREAIALPLAPGRELPEAIEVGKRLLYLQPGPFEGYMSASLALTGAPNEGGSSAFRADAGKAQAPEQNGGAPPPRPRHGSPPQERRIVCYLSTVATGGRSVNDATIVDEGRVEPRAGRTVACDSRFTCCRPPQRGITGRTMCEGQASSCRTVL